MRIPSALQEDEIRLEPAAGAWPRGSGRTWALILAVLGCLALLLATPWGIGASPDSVVYINGARNLAHGNGFSQLEAGGEFQAITHHAPLYAALLAGLERTGVDPLSGARWINAVLFAGLILLMGAILARLLPRRGRWTVLMAGLGAALALAAPVLVEVYLMAWSEALFLPLALGSLWLLALALETGSRRQLLAAAGLAALACLTRYAGLALIVAGGLAILLLSREKPARRLLDGIAFGAVAVIPLALWMARNQIAGGSATSREVGVHLMGLGHVRQAVTTLGGWFFIPAGWPAPVKLLPFVLIGGLFAWQLWKLRTPRPQIAAKTPAAPPGGFPVFVWAGLIFTLVYFGFLAASISFLDANTPLDARILSPLLPVLILVTLYLLDRWAGSSQKRAVVAAVCGLYLLAALVASGVLLRSSFEQGLGFSNRQWQQSPLLASAAALPSGTLIYTNAPEPLELYTRLPVLALPKKYESANQQANPEYAAQMEQVRQAFTTRPAVIAYFTSVQRPSLPALDELQAELARAVPQPFEDGVILALPAP